MNFKSAKLIRPSDFKPRIKEFLESKGFSPDYIDVSKIRNVNAFEVCFTQIKLNGINTVRINFTEERTNERIQRSGRGRFSYYTNYTFELAEETLESQRFNLAQLDELLKKGKEVKVYFENAAFKYLGSTAYFSGKPCTATAKFFIYANELNHPVRVNINNPNIIAIN